MPQVSIGGWRMPVWRDTTSRSRSVGCPGLSVRAWSRSSAMSGEAFKTARDFLLAHRTDHDAAYAGFRWPELDRFNWALDWFDAELARGESANRPALRIVGADAAAVTFAELAERSNRVANGLRALGVGRGDRILLMLGNVAPLWEVMLAAMKLGAVLVPATTLLTPADLAERVERAGVRFVVTAAADRSEE